MVIGVDLTTTETAHMKRGVGFVLSHILANMPKATIDNSRFIFYVHDKKALDIKSINSKIKKFKIHEIPKQKSILNKHKVSKVLTKLRLKSLFDELEGIYCAKFSQKIGGESPDVYIHFEQQKPLPRISAKKVMFVYDLIPYILEKDYLANYKTSRKRGDDFRVSLLNKLRRYSYMHALKANVKRADRIITISEHTTNDLVKHIPRAKGKAKASKLGVTVVKVPLEPKNFNRYFPTSWGDIEMEKVTITGKYLLYVGGADVRKNLTYVFALFNNMKSINPDLQLVLAGDVMTGLDAYPDGQLKDYIKNSYLDDVYFLGYVPEAQKAWLYSNAECLLFPSKYEGFGLPIVEALAYGCPVLTGNNSAIKEKAQEGLLLCDSFNDYCQTLWDLLDGKNKPKISSSKELTKEYSWKKLSKTVFS